MRSGAIPRQWWAILWVVGACARATDGLEPAPAAGGEAGSGSGGASGAGASTGGTLAHAGTTVVAGGSAGTGMVMAFGGTTSAGMAHGGTSTAGAGDGSAGSGAGEAGESTGSGGVAGHGGGTAGSGGAADCDPPSGMTCKDAAAYCATQTYAVGDKVLATCTVNTAGCISGKSWLFTCAKAGCADKAPGTTAGEGYWTITQCQ